MCHFSTVEAKYIVAESGDYLSYVDEANVTRIWYSTEYYDTLF